MHGLKGTKEGTDERVRYLNHSMNTTIHCRQISVTVTAIDSGGGGVSIDNIF